MKRANIFLLLWPLFLSTILYRARAEDRDTWLEFSRVGQPNSLTWEVPPGSLPFTGSYQFFADLSTPVLHLLSVVEARTNLILAECQVAHSTMPQWRSFTWMLNAQSLQCNASSADGASTPEQAEHPLPPLPAGSHQPRAFLVRITPHDGAYCLRNLIVAREFARGCPPKLNAAMTPSPAGGGLLCHQCSLITQHQEQLQQPSARPRLQISKLPPSAGRPTNVAGSSGGDESSIISVPDNDGAQQGSNPQPPQHHPGRSTATGNTPGNSELGVPIAFPLFRPTHSPPTNAASSSSGVTVSDSHDSGPDEDEHLSRAAQEKYKFAGPLHSPANTQQPQFAPASGGDTTIVRRHPCDNFECKNGGRCVVAEDGRPLCLCQPGFTGLRCEVDLCSAVSCPVSSQCKFRGGRAVCECVDGPPGDNCRIHMKQRVVSSINGGASGAPPVIVCAHECANGGKCVTPNNAQSATLNGGVNGVCHCAHGFLGANCNVHDLCADANFSNATCALFGHDAKCFVDAASLASKAPANLVNSPHICMCHEGKGQWVDCSQVVRRLDLNPPSPSGFHLPPTGQSETVETPHIGTLPKSLLEPRLGSAAIQQPQTSTSIPVENVEEPHRRLPPGATTRRTSVTPIRESGGPPEVGSVVHQQHRRPSSPPNLQQPPFPIHVPTGQVGGDSDSTQGHSTTSSQDDTSDGGSEVDTGLIPRFPFTTPTPGVLHAGHGSTLGRPIGDRGQSSSRLNALSGPPSTPTTTTTPRPVPTTTTTAEPVITRPATLPHLPPPGIGDERDGDNGFERVTANLDPTLIATNSTTAKPTTTTRAITLTSTMTTLAKTTSAPTTTRTPTPINATTVGVSIDNEPSNELSSSTAVPSTSTLSLVPLFPHSTEESNHVVEESLDQTGSPPLEVVTSASFRPTDDQSHHGFVETTTMGPRGGNSVMGGIGDEERGPVEHAAKADNGEAHGGENDVTAGGKDAQTGGRGKSNGGGHNEHQVMANILSWIVAIGVITFFLLSVASGAFCVGRYVRRSRRLHGKYNPAREESVAANTYSMPMTTVSDLNPKEERLI